MIALKGSHIMEEYDLGSWVAVSISTNFHDCGLPLSVAVRRFQHLRWLAGRYKDIPDKLMSYIQQYGMRSFAFWNYRAFVYPIKTDFGANPDLELLKVSCSQLTRMADKTHIQRITLRLDSRDSRDIEKVAQVMQESLDDRFLLEGMPEPYDPDEYNRRQRERRAAARAALELELGHPMIRNPGGAPKLALDEIDQRLAEGGAKLLGVNGEYKNNNSVLIVQCRNGHVFENKWKNIQRGSWCPECLLSERRQYRVGDQHYTGQHSGARIESLKNEIGRYCCCLGKSGQAAIKGKNEEELLDLRVELLDALQRRDANSQRKRRKL